MRKIDSSQNFTSIWWSNFFLNFFFSSKKTNFENIKEYFSENFQKNRKFHIGKKIFFLYEIFDFLKIFRKIFFCVFKIIFFPMKKKVEKKIGSSYRCKILWRIDFSHSRSDLATPLTASEDSCKNVHFFCIEVTIQGYHLLSLVELFKCISELRRSLEKFLDIFDIYATRAVDSRVFWGLLRTLAETAEGYGWVSWNSRFFLVISGYSHITLRRFRESS